MQSIAQETANGSAGAASVLAALNNSRMPDQGEAEVNFAAMLEQSDYVVEIDEVTREVVEMDAGETIEAAVCEEISEEVEAVRNLVTESETGDVAVSAEEAMIEAVVAEIAESETGESEAAEALNLDPSLGETMATDEVVDSVTIDMNRVATDIAQETAEIVASETGVPVDDSMGQETGKPEPEVVAQVAAGENAAVTPMDTSVESPVKSAPIEVAAVSDAEQTGPAVNRVDVNRATENQVPGKQVVESPVGENQVVEKQIAVNQAEQVSIDTPRTVAQTQVADAQAEAVVQGVTTTNARGEVEKADSAANMTKLSDEAAVDKGVSNSVSVAAVAQSVDKKTSGETAPIVEAPAAASQGMTAATAQTVSGETRVRNSEGEAMPAAGQDQATLAVEVGADPVALRREMAQVRMQSGMSGVERKVAQAGQAASVEAIAASLKSESGDAVTRQEGIAEAKREPLNTTRFIEDIISQAKMLTKPNGSTEMRLRLDPPELGSLVMRLTLNNNKLDVQIEVDSPAVRQMVGDTLQRVKEMLSGDGVDLEKFDIGLRRQPNQDAGQNGRQGSSRRENGDDSNAMADGRVTDPRADALQRATLSATGMIDFTA